MALTATALMRGEPWCFIPVEWVQETGGAVTACRRAAVPGRLEGLCPALCVLGASHLGSQVQLRGLIYFSDSLGFRKFGLGAEGFMHRNGALAKLDWLPMNGGPEQGQW